MNQSMNNYPDKFLCGIRNAIIPSLLLWMVILWWATSAVAHPECKRWVTCTYESYPLGPCKCEEATP
jgi:hypothetical protein